MNRIEFNQGPSNPFSGIISLVLFALIMVGLFFAVKWIFIGLVVLLPIVLLITFILNDSLVLNYFQSLWNTLKTDILKGMFRIIMMPFALFGLLLQALLLKKVAKTQKEFHNQFQGFEQQFGNFDQPQNRFHDPDDEFTDFEEVEDDLPKK
jgi:hypothetical protein